MIKYQATYKNSLNGDTHNITFDFVNETGTSTPMELLLGGSPGSIEDQGADNTVFFGIMDSKITINLLLPAFNEGLYNAITDVEDKECWVQVTKPGGVLWSGWLIPDEGRRSFDNSNFQISVSCVSPFSIMKNETLTDNSGVAYLYGLQSIETIIRRCLIPCSNTLFSYEIKSSNKSNTIFSDNYVRMESFNDENGQPPTCYDMLDRIVKSTLFNVYWENNQLVFVDPFQNTRLPQTLNIYNHISKDNILLGNSENIAKIKAFKEVSLKLSYGQLAGLLPNGGFKSLSALGYPNSWLVDDVYDKNWNDVIPMSYGTTVLHLGNGSRFDPYRMEIKGELDYNWMTRDGYGGLLYPPVFGFSNKVNVGLNNKFKLRVRFRYYDYKSVHSNDPGNKIPAMMLYVMSMRTVAGASDGTELSYVEDYKNVNGTKYEEDASPVMNPTMEFPAVHYIGFGNQEVSAIKVGIDSSSDIQSYECEFTIPAIAGDPYPYDKDIYVSFSPVLWKYGKPTWWTSADNYIDLIDVTLSSVQTSFGDEVTGEEQYLSQYKNYSKKAETDEIYIGNYPDKTISGALFDSAGVLKENFVSIPFSMSLQKSFLLTQLALNRGPRFKLDFDTQVSNLSITESIEFKNGSDLIIPDTYMIVRRSTDLKTLQHSITAIQMKSEVKDIWEGSNPDEDHDLYEIYVTR